jgi:hypothetical protein
MSPRALLVTSASLGFMVLAAGAYGLLYGIGRFRNSRGLMISSGVAYAALILDAVTIIVATPLALEWKSLIAVSALAYLGIPPLTWRYLQHTHREDGAHP